LPLAGLVAAFITVLITDVFRIIPIPEITVGLTPEQARQHVYATVAFGTLLGVLLAAAQHMLSGRRQFYRILPFAIGAGAFCAFLGVQFGMSLMAPLYAATVRNPAQFLGNVIARGLAWMMIGGFVGLGDGFRTRSVQTGRNGAIGGLLGGFLGGLLFECIPFLLPTLKVGAVSRMVGFATTGASIGLFIGLVQQFLQEAWLRLELGRNEGRDFVIDQDTMTLGRSELDGIPLYGDPQIAKSHALLQKVNGTWMLSDRGQSPVGTLVNGQRIGASHTLRPGDRISIGSANLTFQLRNVTAYTQRVPAEAARTAPAASPVAQSQATQQGFTTTPMQAAANPITLRITGGPAAGQVISLRGDITIGRDPASTDFPIAADDKLSRRHIRIYSPAGKILVEDCGSTNGTFINGQRIHQQELVSGDTIHIGATTLRAE
jgi:pSer/pThr/pTyr-binding forkhead associated (FHA) protein